LAQTVVIGEFELALPLLIFRINFASLIGDHQVAIYHRGPSSGAWSIYRPRVGRQFPDWHPLGSPVRLDPILD